MVFALANVDRAQLRYGNDVSARGWQKAHKSLNVPFWLKARDAMSL